MGRAFAYSWLLHTTFLIQEVNLRQDRHVVFVVGKVVGYVLATGEYDDFAKVVSQFDAKFNVEAISYFGGFSIRVAQSSTGRENEH